jgi:hypothetical protein
MAARSGYWAIKLTEDSSKLTTFNTPLSERLTKTYEGLDGVVAIVNEILIYG